MKTTILVKRETRERLRQLGRKSQTYDQLISELIENRVREYDLHDCEGSHRRTSI